MRADQIIIEPLLTEKVNAMREGEIKRYAFKVHPDANKYQIVDAVEALFSVRPVKCNVINVKAKPRNARTKKGIRRGATTPWRKAIVTLKDGEKIDTLEGV